MLTRNKLKKLTELTANVNNRKELASELLRTAQDRQGGDLIKLERDGKQIELKQKVMWEEVFYMGAACQAGKLLSKVHPEVFEAFKNQETSAAELKKFTIAELGMDYTQLTLSDYLKMTEELVEIMLSERNLSKKSWLFWKK